jgi:hypothetical protein
VQRHEHPQLTDLAPVFAKERMLPIDGCGSCLRNSWKGGVDRTPDRLEEHATVGLNGRIEQGSVAVDGVRHRRSVLLPEGGAALDVGDEEGDGTAGQIGHDIRSAPLSRHAANGKSTSAYGTTRQNVSQKH